jgi:hypothetical protein
MSRLGPVEIELPAGWEDITDALGSSPPPFSLSRGAESPGVFQLSAAIFARRRLPGTTLEGVRGLCVDFGRRKNLEPGESHSSHDDPARTWFGMNYKIRGRRMRVWYASDGLSFVLATFVPTRQSAESTWADGVADCERMLSSLTFPGPA